MILCDPSHALLVSRHRMLPWPSLPVYTKRWKSFSLAQLLWLSRECVHLIRLFLSLFFPVVFLFALGLQHQAKKIEAHRESLVEALQNEMETEDAPELEEEASAAVLAASDSAADPDGEESVREEEDPAGGSTGTGIGSDGKNTAKDSEVVEVRTSPSSPGKSSNEEGDTSDSESDDGSASEDEARDALAEEQKRLDELDRAEHEAEMARIKK